MVDLFDTYKVEKSETVYCQSLNRHVYKEKKMENYSDSYQNGGDQRDTDFQKLAQN